MASTPQADSKTSATDRGTAYMTKRSVLHGIGTLALGAGGATAILTRSADPVLAVSIGSLDVPDTTEEVSGVPTSVPVTVDAQFEGETNEPLDQVLVELLAQIDGDTESVSTDAVFDLSESFTGSVQLSGDLLDHANLSANDLAPPSGETATKRVKLILVAQAILDGGIHAEDSVLQEVDATAEGVNTIAVSVGGSGTVEIQE